MANALLKPLVFLMPNKLANQLRPFWWKFLSVVAFFRSGGRARYSRLLGGWVVSKPALNGRFTVVVRSYREFRRFTKFDEDPDDVVHIWLRDLKECSTLWDIGSANGLEGMYAYHVHRANVIFLEPYAPSVETILKSIYQVKVNQRSSAHLEVVQAFCDSRSGYDRLMMANPPVPGMTLNTAESGSEDYCDGGRIGLKASVSQWVASVCLDDLFKWDIPKPSHVKIDIDGIEERALAGAKNLLASKTVREWVIEVNDNRGPSVIATMEENGYTKVGEYDHGKPDGRYTCDFIFVRDDLI